jgi:putative ABC transport system substrate-binding protein
VTISAKLSKKWCRKSATRFSFLPPQQTRKLFLLAASKNMPAIYQFSAYVDLGGLASYGASLALMGKQTAQYAAKIFQGAKPAELPVEQPVAFELALNLKTAAALGVSIPAAIIAQADKVIE